MFVWDLTIFFLKLVSNRSENVTHGNSEQIKEMKLKEEQRNGNVRNQFDERLRSQSLNLRYQTILAAVPYIIMEVDINKKYTWANKAGYEFFGDDVIGKEAAFYFEGEQETYNTIQPLFYGSEDTIYVESWQRRKDGERRLLAWWCHTLKDSSGNILGALSTARDITDKDYYNKLVVIEIICKDGRHVWFEHKARPIKDNNNNIIGLHGIGRDITEQKRLDEELQKLNAELEQRVKERTSELEEKNTNLQTMFKGFVNQEMRMVELKKKNAELEKEISSLKESAGTIVIKGDERGT